MVFSKRGRDIEIILVEYWRRGLGGVIREVISWLWCLGGFRKYFLYKGNKKCFVGGGEGY